jgi:HK97 family phage prohead protease
VGWHGLVGEALNAATSPEFMRLETAISYLLEAGHVLDADLLKRVHTIAAGEAEVERKAVEASSRTGQDLGEFTAIAACYSTDREKDRIRPGAFEQTITRWQASGKKIPVHWDHRGGPENIIGWVDPKSMREEPGLGLFVAGKLDIDDSRVARAAWRLMKANSVGFSFGYLAQASRTRSDGGRDLIALDLFEISATPAPINPDTGILQLKSTALFEEPIVGEYMEELARLDADDKKRAERELRRKCHDLAREAALGWQEVPKPADCEVTAPTVEELRRRAAELGLPLPKRRARDFDPDAVRAEWRDRMTAPLAADEQAAKVPG